MDFPRESGIYKISNIVNNKVYIGQSVDIHRRVVTHLRELRNGIHHNTYLQSAWDKYGEEAFEFSIVELCPPELLNSKEIHYIAKYDSVRTGYNLTDGGLGCSGYKQPESVRLATKLRNSKSVTLLNTGKAFMSTAEASQKYPSNRVSITRCCKRSIRHAGSLDGEKLVWAYTDEYRLMSDEDIRERIRLSTIKNEGANCTSSKPVVLLNFDEYFDCVTSAARKYGICVTLVAKCCRGAGLSAGSYDGEKLVWCFYEDYKTMSDSDIDNKINYAQVSMRGKNHFGAKSVKLLNTGEVFECMSDAARKYGITLKGISQCCTGAKKSSGKLNGKKMIWAYC